MMLRQKNIISLILLLSIMASPLTGVAQRTKSSNKSGEQRNSEKGLNDNRYFFYFINSSVSNFGSDEQKKLYREAIQRDMIAQILYMKFTFHESFIEIRRSQKLMIDLYRTVLDQDIGGSQKLLNGFAPDIASRKDATSRHYLYMGYRDLALSKQYFLMADNYQEALYSMRLYKYVHAIKLAKHARRYALLAALESKKLREDYRAVEKEIRLIYAGMHETNDEKKVEENRVKLKAAKQRLKLAKAELGYLSFDELLSLIVMISPEKKDYHSLVHYDNYYRTRDGVSFFDKIWDDPRLEEIKEYEEYRKNY
jgi:hypothetical protein